MRSSASATDETSAVRAEPRAEASANTARIRASLVPKWRWRSPRFTSASAAMSRVDADGPWDASRCLAAAMMARRTSSRPWGRELMLDKRSHLSTLSGEECRRMTTPVEEVVVNATQTALRTDTIVQVNPMSGYTGAELAGVDLTQPLDAAVIAQIREALLQWKVVFFRDQDITQDQHVAFGRLFGQVTAAHP